MNLLLDTNAFVKWQDGTIPTKVRRYVEKPNAERFVSIVTPWEIAIKSNAARQFRMLSADEVKESIRRLGARLLPLTLEHTNVIYALPLHHNDPFDRMIIAQALHEKCLVVSSDERFPLYRSVGLQVLWD